MKRKDTLAGIFFADHKVIWVTARTIDRNTPYPAQVFDLSSDFITNTKARAERFNAHPTAAEDVDAALSAIAKTTDILEIEAVTSASLGPFTLGQSCYDEGGHIISGARSTKWQNVDLYNLIQEGLRRHGNSHCKVRCLTDAEAMVVGEHYLYRQDKLSASIPGSPDYSELMRDMGKDTVAYLLLDEGVGGSIFRRNQIIRGDASLELGHIPIYPTPADSGHYPIASCGAHYLPCLEGTIGLKALRDKWTLEYSDYLNLDIEAPKLKWIGYYVAQAVHTIAITHTPTVTLIGGALARNPNLLPHVQFYYDELGSNRRSPDMYPDYKSQYDLDEFIQYWSNPDAGVLGCLCWSHRTLEQASARPWYLKNE